MAQVTVGSNPTPSAQPLNKRPVPVDNPREEVAVLLDKAPEGMRRFTMRREFDVSGVSGTGTVVEGV